MGEIRDLTRYQTKLTEERSREKQRLLKVLEAAGIKLDVVASDTFGVSGRSMLDALVAGERGRHLRRRGEMPAGGGAAASAQLRRSHRPGRRVVSAALDRVAAKAE